MSLNNSNAGIETSAEFGLLVRDSLFLDGCLVLACLAGIAYLVVSLHVFVLGKLWSSATKVSAIGHAISKAPVVVSTNVFSKPDLAALTLKYFEADSVANDAMHRNSPDRYALCVAANHAYDQLQAARKLHKANAASAH
jgi:hypothetical protein